jgi:ABC-type oligopeptide transport system substrate-binding subunit
MLAVGLSLFVAAGFAGTASSSPTKTGKAGKTALKKGGTLRVNFPVSDIDDVDPSIAYGTVTWHIEYATALKLLNYPDANPPKGSRLVPEGASKYAVSPNGRTYTFTIRPGFKFSNGAKVTAKNYAFAINRSLGDAIQSPAFAFVADENATNIVGAQDVRDGKATNAKGVKVKGNKLIISLTKPDATFLAKISMPFFQAQPLTLSRTDKVINVDSSHPLPSAGPYYISFREPNRLVTLKKNPNYAKGVSSKYKKRAANLSAINIKVAVNLESAYQEVKADQADYTYSLPPTAPAELGQQYGLKGRFRVRTATCVTYMALNSNNALFRNNPSLRKAVNYIINRNSIISLYGAYAGAPTDQYLPKGFPGFRELGSKGYPNTQNRSKAQQLAQGHVPSGGPWKLYYGLASPGPQVMELVRSYLSQIGVSIDPQGFRGFAIYDAAGKRNSPHAFTLGTGWCQDYPDPYDFINILLYGGNIQDENNNNIAYFNSSKYNKRMENAAKLIGGARLKGYANLENDLVTKAAPWAAYRQPTDKFFFSSKVDQRSWLFNPVYEEFSYNVLALK